jgi:hypothetical protein
MKTAVLISALVAFVGAWRVTRFFWLKRNGDSAEQRLEEERDLDARRHQDQ